MVKGVFLDNNYEIADFKYPAESIMYDFENSPIRTSIASILKNITDPLMEMQEIGINNVYAPKNHVNENNIYGAASSKMYGHIKIGDGFVTTLNGPVVEVSDIEEKEPVTIDCIPGLEIWQRENAATNREDYGMFVGYNDNLSYYGFNYVICDPEGNFSEVITGNGYVSDTESGHLVGFGDSFLWIGGWSPSDRILICHKNENDEWIWEHLAYLPYSGSYRCLVAYDMINGKTNWKNNHTDKVLIANYDGNDYLYFYWLDYGSNSLREVFTNGDNYLSMNHIYSGYSTNIAFFEDYIVVIDVSNNRICKRKINESQWDITETSLSSYFSYGYTTLVFAENTNSQDTTTLQLCGSNGTRLKLDIYSGGASWSVVQSDYFEPYDNYFNASNCFIANNGYMYRLYYGQEDSQYKTKFNSCSILAETSDVRWVHDSFLLYNPEPEPVPPEPWIEYLEVDPEKVLTEGSLPIDIIPISPGPISPFGGDDVIEAPIIPKGSSLDDVREPLPHASLLKIYGLSTVDLYGHARLVDDYSHIVFEKTSGATTITEMPFCIWQRNNTAINQDGVLLATGELARNNNEFVYSLFNESGLTDPTVSRVSSFRNGEIVGFGDGFLWFGGFRDPYALWFYNPKTSTWHRLPDLPLSFENGQVSQNLPGWTFDEYPNDNVYVMFYNNSNNCYAFGRIDYNEMSQGVVGTDINPLYLDYDASPNNLAFATTPSYLVVLDTTREHHIMYKNPYHGGWGTASNNLPFLYEKQINNPTAITYSDYNGGDFLHVMGPIDNGHFIHKVFDLYRNWSEPADANALPYISDYGYSMCLKDNKLYLFIPNSNETTEIYCCDANTMNPVWQKTYLSVVQSGFHEISDLAIWQRNNVAINSDNEMMLIGGSTWTPRDYIYDNHKIIINDILSNFIPDFDSGNVIGWNDKFLWFGGYETHNALCIGYKDSETNQWIWDWDNNNPLPYEFYGDDNCGSIAKITFTTSRSEQEQILIMLCDPNISYDDMYGYKFYWYDRWGDFYPAFYYDDQADPTSYQDNVFYTQNSSKYLTLVLTPAYIVVLDTYNKQMWKHSWDYYGSWRQANNSLPLAKELYYPSTICYGNDFYYDGSSGPSYLHIMGTIYNGHFFHKIFDLYNMEWGDPANCSALPWMCRNSSEGDNYCYNGGYSVILKGNKIYLFTTGDGQNYDAEGSAPTRIYSCQADTMSPIWQEDFLPTDPDEGDQGGSEKVGGNGMVASSFAVTTFRKDIDAEIDQIMYEDDFHAELDRRLTEYLKDIHSQ